MRIDSHPQSVRRVLFLAALGLAGTGLVTQYVRLVLGWNHALGLVPVFDLNSDSSVPTWFSSVGLLLCSISLGLIAATQRKIPGGFSRHWAFLALTFLALSVDEVAMIHEMVGMALAKHMRVRGTGFLRYTWVIPYGCVVAAIGLGSRPFLRHLPVATRNRFLMAGAVYVGGAIGMEMVCANYHHYHGVANMGYQTLCALEESMEMAGIILFLDALLRHVFPHGFSLRLSPLESGSGRPT